MTFACLLCTLRNRASTCNFTTMQGFLELVSLKTLINSNMSSELMLIANVMAQISLYILNNCLCKSCFMLKNKQKMLRSCAIAQCDAVDPGRVHIGQRTNYTHSGVPALPSHPMIVIISFQ